jgi:hypothetical protein
MGRESMRLVTAVAVVVTALGVSATPSRAAGTAGHWRATYTVTCLNSPHNVALCKDLFGDLKAIGKANTLLNLVGSDVYTVAANGTYTDISRLTLTERARAGRPKNCATDPGLRLFNGSCVINSSGRGHLTKGFRGLPIFHEDAENVSIVGVAGYAHLKGKDANSGPPAPARAGSYSASWIAASLGFKQTPPGVAGGFIMTHGR